MPHLSCRYYKDQVFVSTAEGNIIIFKRSVSKCYLKVIIQFHLDPLKCSPHIPSALDVYRSAISAAQTTPPPPLSLSLSPSLFLPLSLSLSLSLSPSPSPSLAGGFQLTNFKTVKMGVDSSINTAIRCTCMVGNKLWVGIGGSCYFLNMQTHKVEVRGGREGGREGGSMVRKEGKGNELVHIHRAVSR